MSRTRQGLVASWLASPPPDAAIEIAADHVAAAVVTTRRGGDVVLNAYASEPIRPGLVTPSLTAANIQDRPAMVAAIRRVVEKLGTRPRRIALVIPDTAVKVSLLRFENVPARRDDFEQLVRWQLRKAAPFPIDTAAVSYSASLPVNGGREFVVEIARHECVREYESICEEAGLYAGLVETATFSLLGLFGGTAAEQGDWLLVHVRPDYTSLVIMRDDAVIFYRNRSEDGQEPLPDLVHQTSMYYQDRLSGGTFAKVYLAGGDREAGGPDVDVRAIEERLGAAVTAVDPTRAATLPDRIAAPPGLTETIGPSIGLLRRTHAEVRV